MKTKLSLLMACSSCSVSSFQIPFYSTRDSFVFAIRRRQILLMSDEGCDPLDPTICKDFTILVCRSTSCSQKRKVLGLDEFETFGALYERRESAYALDVEIEEAPCLGGCKLAPCVAVTHEDYMGNVALEGMTPNELSARVFHG